MSVGSLDTGEGWRSWARWAGAALIVLVAHAVGAWMIARQKPAASAGEAAPAIMVELAPLPVAPAAEPVDLAPGPETEDAPPEPVVETPDPPVEPEPPEPEIDMPPPPEPAEPVFEEPKPHTEVQPDLPETPPVPEPAVVLPSPTPPAAPPKRPVERPRPVEKPKEKKQVRPQTRTATAPPRTQPAAAPAAPSAGVAATPSVSPANWRGALLAQLNRAKRYPADARSRREEGTVRLSFSIDRSGRVIGYQIVGSSGSASLDQEALSLIQRASPLPAPPPDVQGSRISLTVPVRFNLN